METKILVSVELVIDTPVPSKGLEFDFSKTPELSKFLKSYGEDGLNKLISYMYKVIFELQRSYIYEITKTDISETLDDNLKLFLKYFGNEFIYDVDSGNIFAKQDEYLSVVAEVRGWGNIANLVFKNRLIDMDRARDFQDFIGVFMANAMTEKLNTLINKK